MECNHDFHEIEKTTKSNNSPQTTAAPIGNRWSELHGVKLGCVNCGEIRVLWENGTIDTQPQSNDVKS